MRCRANSSRGWEPRRTFVALGALAVCLLVGSLAYGEETAVAAPGKPLCVVSAAPDTTEQTVRQALKLKADFDFNETSLADVAKKLTELTKVEFQLDNKALADIGVASDMPITFSAHGITVRSALRLMLRPHGLTYTFQDEVVLLTTPEEAENRLTTKIYQVHDLVTTKPTYRFEGIYVPGVSSGAFPRTIPSRPVITRSPIPVMGGLGAPPSGRGMIGAPKQPQPSTDTTTSNENPSSPQPKNPATFGEDVAGVQDGLLRRPPIQPSETDMSLVMDDLIELIKTCVRPTSWDDTGGAGSIYPVAGALVISQTQEVHEEIEDLLCNLRAGNPQLQVVTIRATWLLLDLKQVNQLVTSKPGKDGGIDPKALEEMTTKAKGGVGTITGFSGQTVHIASGFNQSAMFAMNPAASIPQSGVMLQVTPQLLANTQTALLDICSSVTRSVETAEKTSVPSIEQLATTLKVTLGEPALVGGLTSALPSPSTEGAAGAQQLYLFIEATAR
jgi:hypothetical protein